MGTGLKEFLARQTTRTRCRACMLPTGILGQVDEALREGASPTAVARWLREEMNFGNITATIISHHRDRGHAEVLPPRTDPERSPRRSRRQPASSARATAGERGDR
jgi:hypothetical protein